MKVGDKPLVGTTPLSQPEAKQTTATPAAPEKSNGWSAKARRTPPPTVAVATNGTAKAAAPAISSAAAKPPLWVPPSKGQFTLDSHGVQSDPVNIYVHGSLDQLKASLAKAGWTEAAVNNKADNSAYLKAIPEHEGIQAWNKLDNVAENAWKKLTGKTVDLDVHDTKNDATINSMPVSPQTLDGQPNISSWENKNNPLAGRDHLRIFDTGKVDGQGNHVYAIAASRDTGIKLDKNRPEQGFLNHAVEKNTDLERNSVVSALEGTGNVGETRQFKLDYGDAPAAATGAKSNDSQAYDLVLK